MLVTKIALPRRTFLRGVGATLALPLLDAMVPALSALAKTEARAVPPSASSIRRTASCRTSGRRQPKAGRSSFTDPQPAPAAPRPRARGERTGASPGGVVRRRQCGSPSSHRRLAERRTCLDAQHGVGDQPEHDRRSDRCGNNRQGHAPPSLELAFEPDVDCLRQRRGLLYSNTVSWRTPTTPPAGRSAPARRVRAAVRRRRHRRRAPRRQP